MVASDTRILLVSVKLKCFKCHLLRSLVNITDVMVRQLDKKVSNELNITSETT